MYKLELVSFGPSDTFKDKLGIYVSTSEVRTFSKLFMFTNSLQLFACVSQMSDSALLQHGSRSFIFTIFSGCCSIKCSQVAASCLSARRAPPARLWRSFHDLIFASCGWLLCLSLFSFLVCFHFLKLARQVIFRRLHHFVAVQIAKAISVLSRGK